MSSSSSGSAKTRRRHFDPKQREQWLERYERSGLSLWQFARQAGLNYSTLTKWLQRRAGLGPRPQPRAQPKVAFAEVLTPELGAREERIEVHLPDGTQVRLNSAVPPQWAATLIGSLKASKPC